VSGAILATPRPTFSGLAGRAAGDENTVTLRITSVSGSSQTLKLVPADGGWTTAATGPLLPDGIYLAVAEQADEAGNTATSATTFAINAAPSPAPSGSSSAAPPSAPVASFQWFPSAPHVGEPVSLVSNSTDLSSPINAFAWDLSGAFVAGSSLLTTSFSTPGPHVVRLRVTDANGLSGAVAQTIVVTPASPSLMQPFPVVRIAGSESWGGVRISLLSVQAPVGSRVRVACHGGGCVTRSQQLVAAARRSTGSAGTVLIEFRRFERSLRAGASLEIRVSKPGEIGKYTRFSVRRGRLPARLDTCLAPTGIKPMACPSS
jgi:hypothetical protein